MGKSASLIDQFTLCPVRDIISIEQKLTNYNKSRRDEIEKV